MQATISNTVLRQYLSQLFSSGRFRTEEEAIEQALELMRSSDEAADEMTPELRRKIEQADRDIAAGRFVEIDELRKQFVARGMTGRHRDD